MPTDQAPWEVIRRAADRLDDLVARWGEENRWESVHQAELLGMPAPGGDWYSWAEVAGLVNGTEGGRSNAALSAAQAWITALSPAVAEPLVAWLRGEAIAWEDEAEACRIDGLDPIAEFGPVHRYALDFAHLVLKGEVKCRYGVQCPDTRAITR